MVARVGRYATQDQVGSPQLPVVMHEDIGAKDEVELLEIKLLEINPLKWTSLRRTLRVDAFGLL